MNQGRKKRANLGKKQRNSSGGRASGNKRKLKEVATPNKRLRAGQEVVLVQQNHTSCSEYEGEIMESLPEYEGVWDVEEAIELPCSNTNMQIVEVGSEMESLPEDFDSFDVEAIDLPCSNTNIPACSECEMLDQILEHDGRYCCDDEGIQYKQIRGSEEGAPLVH